MAGANTATQYRSAGPRKHAAAMAVAPVDGMRLHLLALPEDLLDCIVDQLPVSDLESLKHLRMAHRQLASLKRLLHALFHTIVLTPYGAQKGLDSSVILPRVRQVTFKSTPGKCDYSDLTRQERDTATRLPIAYKHFYLSGAAEEAIVKILTQMPNIRSVKMQPSNPPAGSVLVPPLKYLVRFATDCLIKAGVKVQEITYHDCANQTLAFRTGQVTATPDWTKLDLSSLKSFTFDVQRHRGHGQYGVANTVVQGTLRNTAASLERLSMRTPQVSFRYRLCALAMNSLRLLHIEQCSIHQEDFASWLLLCPRMEDLTLRQTKTTFNSWIYHVDAWKPVFDALRRHPTRMKVIFDRVSIDFWDGSNPDFFNSEDDFTLSLTCQTACGVDVDEGEVECQDDPEVTEARDIRMAINYMAAVSDWNLPPRFRRSTRSQ